MSVVSDIMAESTKIIGFVAFFYIMNAFVKGLGALGSALNKARGGLGGGLSKAGGKFGEDLANRNKLRALEGREGKLGKPVAGFRRWQARREGIREGVKRETGRATHEYQAGLTKEGSRYTQQVAGGGFGQDANPQAVQRALANASATREKAFDDEVSAASSAIKNRNLDRNLVAMRTIAKGGTAEGIDGSNDAVRKAAMQNVVNAHDIPGVNQLLDSVGSMDERTRESFADSLLSSKERPLYVGQGAISDIRQHGTTSIDEKTGKRFVVSAKSSKDLAAAAIDNNTYSVNNIANGDKEELSFVAGVAADPKITTNNKRIKENAKQAQSNSRYSGQISKNAPSVDALAALK